jgi:DNA-directed RNA polymerase specialized sigma24 family protein
VQPRVPGVHEALEKLAEIDERKCRVVELRYFLELTAKETADVLGISESTVNRDWDWAKTWLFREWTRHGGQREQNNGQIEGPLEERTKDD